MSQIVGRYTSEPELQGNDMKPTKGNLERWASKDHVSSEQTIDCYIPGGGIDNFTSVKKSLLLKTGFIRGDGFAQAAMESQLSKQYLDSHKVVLPSRQGRDHENMLGLKHELRVYNIGSYAITADVFIFFQFATEVEAASFESYMKTAFARQMISHSKNDHVVDRMELKWLPILPWNRQWTNEAVLDYLEIQAKWQAALELKLLLTPEEQAGAIVERNVFVENDEEDLPVLFAYRKERRPFSQLPSVAAAEDGAEDGQGPPLKKAKHEKPVASHIPEEYAALQLPLGLRPYPIAKDGNCLFASLAHQFWWSETYVR